MSNINNSQLKFLGLKEDTFVNDITQIQYFLDYYQYGITLQDITDAIMKNNLDITQLAGEIGVGKSYTCAVLTQRLRTLGCYVVFLESACKNYDLFLQAVLKDLTGVIYADPIKMESEFTKTLESIAFENSQLVIIVDECQMYDSITLNWIRQLTNKNSKADKKLISLVLVGQPELVQLTMSIPALYSRIRYKKFFSYLNADEVNKYIEFKLSLAGYSKKKPNPFASYIQDIHIASKGSPRTINNICSLALILTAKRKEKEISFEVMSEAIRNYKNE